MTSKTPYLVLRADDVEPFTHPEELGYHSQHILGHETTGGHDLLLNRGTVDAHHGLGGTNHPDNDEVYFALSGWAWVDLGGHPDTGEGAQTYRIEPGMVTFIPAGVFHRLAQRRRRALHPADDLAPARQAWGERDPRHATRHLGDGLPATGWMPARDERRLGPRDRARIGLGPPRYLRGQPASGSTLAGIRYLDISLDSRRRSRHTPPAARRGMGSWEMGIPGPDASAFQGRDRVPIDRPQA